MGPVYFSKRLISYETFESAAFADIDGDGVLDIISGGWWYRGPDFQERYPTCTVARYGEYYDDFAAIMMDLTKNGLPDYISGGWWGQTLYWRENPGEYGKLWNVHLIAHVGNIETVLSADLDGDGVEEIIPNTPGFPLQVCKVNQSKIGDPTQYDYLFEHFIIHDRPQSHGLGIGDINQDGRLEVITNEGWYEAPEQPWKEKWIFHPDFQLFPFSSIPILVEDVNGDGNQEIIVGAAHGYGLVWLEKRIRKGKRIEWVIHPIDPFHSQYHAMKWIDIDRDGQGELITGHRWRAHCGKDPGEKDPYGIYYFKWNGEGFTKHVIDFGKVGFTKGLGIWFDVKKLKDDGNWTILAPGKDGLWIFSSDETY